MRASGKMTSKQRPEETEPRAYPVEEWDGQGDQQRQRP